MYIYIYILSSVSSHPLSSACTEMMHSAVAGSVWATVLSTFEWSTTALAAYEPVKESETLGTGSGQSQSSQNVQPISAAKPKFGFSFDCLDWSKDISPARTWPDNGGKTGLLLLLGWGTGLGAHETLTLQRWPAVYWKHCVCFAVTILDFRVSISASDP